MARIAVIQMLSRPSERSENLKRALDLIRRAADMGAELAVLPELCITGYDLRTEQIAAVAEPLDGPTVAALTGVARERKILLACGLPEQADGRYYNSAVLVGPDGLIGAYRKAHLFAGENELFTPGDSGLPVFETPLGRIGLLICYDLRFPEAVRQLAMDGADFICIPTAWVTLQGRALDDRGWSMQVYCAMAHASMNQVVIACADQTGPWRQSQYLGGSLIAGPDGWPVAGPAPVEGEAVLIGEVDVAAVRSSRQRNQYNHTWSDRRLDLYSLAADAAVLGEWDRVSVREPHPGVRTRRRDHAKMTVVRYEFTAGAEFPQHFHPEEQLVVMVAGEMEFTSGGQTDRVRAGQILISPPDVPHGGRAGAGGAVFLNVLAPRREGDTLQYVR